MSEEHIKLAIQTLRWADDQNATDNADQAWDELAALQSRLTLAEAELAKARKLARRFMNEVPTSEIELAREVWGNTNTRCVLEAREALAAFLAEQPK
jgi:hypothetical protein